MDRAGCIYTIYERFGKPAGSPKYVGRALNFDKRQQHYHSFRNPKKKGNCNVEHWLRTFFDEHPTSDLWISIVESVPLYGLGEIDEKGLDKADRSRLDKAEQDYIDEYTRQRFKLLNERNQRAGGALQLGEDGQFVIDFDVDSCLLTGTAELANRCTRMKLSTIVESGSYGLDEYACLLGSVTQSQACLQMLKRDYDRIYKESLGSRFRRQYRPNLLHGQSDVRWQKDAACVKAAQESVWTAEGILWNYASEHPMVWNAYELTTHIDRFVHIDEEDERCLHFRMPDEPPYGGTYFTPSRPLSDALRKRLLSAGMRFVWVDDSECKVATTELGVM